ncbi:hypothetical protein CBS147346_4016 [Aspergillus niger]|nr:hypothetical protein CBS147346_4016 [Aspergillus niger]
MKLSAIFLQASALLIAATLASPLPAPDDGSIRIPVKGAPAERDDGSIRIPVKGAPAERDDGVTRIPVKGAPEKESDGVIRIPVKGAPARHEVHPVQCKIWNSKYISPRTPDSENVQFGP